ncbi:MULTISPECIES: phage tail protein [Photorhabdus]|nr:MULTISPECIES: phage tail protein [Photorhabdus]
MTETVELAKSAVPNNRKINGKALSGDVSLNAGDVGAFPDVRGGLSDNGRFSDMRETGIYLVTIANPNSVTDLPSYNNVKIYSYGFLSVFKSNDQRIHQTYYSHHGDIATRQTWDGPEQYLPWTIQYSTTSPALPVGVPLPYPHRYTPQGYLTCNGQTFDKSLYPKLAEAYPAGRVPDLRGEFIRGWDDSRGVDPGRVCGTWQGDAIQNITGGFAVRLMDGYSQLESLSGAFNATRNSSSGLYASYPSGKRGADDVTFDASRVARTANETRPRNVAFNYIVRAA